MNGYAEILDVPRGHSDAGYTASNGVPWSLQRGEDTSSDCSRLSQAPGSGTRKQCDTSSRVKKKRLQQQQRMESRDKSSIFETMITVQNHTVQIDRPTTSASAEATTALPMKRRLLESKYSVQVPYFNELTVAYVYAPMERYAK